MTISDHRDYAKTTGTFPDGGPSEVIQRRLRSALEKYDSLPTNERKPTAWNAIVGQVLDVIPIR